MVTILGSATAGYSYDTAVPDLPRPQLGATAAHSPWCVDCKRKGRPLDESQRCENCVRAAASRAAAAERRAAAEQAAAERATPAGGGATVKAAERAAEKARAAEERAAAREAAKAQRAAERAAVQEAAKRDRPTSRRAATQSSRAASASGRSPARGGPQRMVLPAPEIVAAYAAGQTLAQIAHAHGCSGPTIGRLLEDHGIKRRGGPVPRNPELLEQVRQLYVDEKLTRAEVAARIGYSVKVVQNVLAELHIEPRPSASERSKAGIGRPIKIPFAERPKIVERYRNGESGSAIALTYGVAAASIYSILRGAGVEERHGNRTLAGPGRNHAAHISVRLAELGVSAAEVKAWALQAGLVARVTRGLPSAAVLEAYAAAR